MSFSTKSVSGNEFAKLRAIRACVPAWFTCQRACVPKAFQLRANVLTCHTRANVLTWRANVPKGVPIFQVFLLGNAKWNFCTLLLYRKFYILLDIVVIYIIFICVVNINCITIHFHTSCRIKEECEEFFLFYYFFLFCSLVRN